MSRGCQDRRGKIWRIAAVFAASGALALSGCTSSTERAAPTSTESAAPTSTESAAPTTQTTAATAEKVDAIANTVPENIKSTGKLVVGVNIPFTPNSSRIPTARSSASFFVKLPFGGRFPRLTGGFAAFLVVALFRQPSFGVHFG